MSKIVECCRDDMTDFQYTGVNNALSDLRYLVWSCLKDLKFLGKCKMVLVLQNLRCIIHLSTEKKHGIKKSYLL